MSASLSIDTANINCGPPMIPLESRAKRKRRRLEKKQTRKQKQNRQDENSAHIVVSARPASLPKEGPDHLVASVLPAGFPPELAFRALAAYSLLRTLSLQLRLSPFTPNVFLRALHLPYPNKLLGQVHVSLLRILLPELHMGYSYRPMSSPTTVYKKRRRFNTKWPLRAGDNLTYLDGLTWPLFYDDYVHLTADELWSKWNDNHLWTDQRSAAMQSLLLEPSSEGSLGAEQKEEKKNVVKKDDRDQNVIQKAASNNSKQRKRPECDTKRGDRPVRGVNKVDSFLAEEDDSDSDDESTDWGSQDEEEFVEDDDDDEDFRVKPRVTRSRQSGQGRGLPTKQSKAASMTPKTPPAVPGASPHLAPGSRVMDVFQSVSPFKAVPVPQRYPLSRVSEPTSMPKPTEATELLDRKRKRPLGMTPMSSRDFSNGASSNLVHNAATVPLNKKPKVATTSNGMSPSRAPNGPKVSTRYHPPIPPSGAPIGHAQPLAPPAPVHPPLYATSMHPPLLPRPYVNPPPVPRSQSQFPQPRQPFLATPLIQQKSPALASTAGRGLASTVAAPTSRPYIKVEVKVPKMTLPPKSNSGLVVSEDTADVIKKFVSQGKGCKVQNQCSGDQRDEENNAVTSESNDNCKGSEGERSSLSQDLATDKLNDSESTPSESIPAEQDWSHFDPIKSMRAGVPYHRLSLKNKLKILEFLLDEILSVDDIAAEFSRRKAMTDCYEYPYGSLPTKSELDSLDNEDECGVCGLEGDLLCCDGCIASYHRPCIGMSELDKLPEGKWLCPECCITDPAMFGPLRGGKKGCLDWFKLSDVEMAVNSRIAKESAVSSASELVAGGSRSETQAAPVPRTADPAQSDERRETPLSDPSSSAKSPIPNDQRGNEYLVVHGFVFKRCLEAFERVDVEMKERLLLPMAPKEIFEELKFIGPSLALEWPLAQIPLKSGIVWGNHPGNQWDGIQQYFLPLSYNPSAYISSYRLAPLPRFVKAGTSPRTKRLLLADYESECGSADTRFLSNRMSSDMSVDGDLVRLLSTSVSFFNPYSFISNYIIRLEKTLRRCYLLHESWGITKGVYNPDEWVSRVLRGRSIVRLAKLLVNLIDAAHARAFSAEWRSVGGTSFISSDDAEEANEVNYVRLPLDWTPEEELKKRNWQRSRDCNILCLLSRESKKLGVVVGSAAFVNHDSGSLNRAKRKKENVAKSFVCAASFGRSSAFDEKSKSSARSDAKDMTTTVHDAKRVVSDEQREKTKKYPTKILNVSTEDHLSTSGAIEDKLPSENVMPKEGARILGTEPVSVVHHSQEAKLTQGSSSLGDSSGCNDSDHQQNGTQTAAIITASGPANGQQVGQTQIIPDEGHTPNADTKSLGSINNLEGANGGKRKKSTNRKRRSGRLRHDEVEQTEVGPSQTDVGVRMNDLVERERDKKLSNLKELVKAPFMKDSLMNGYWPLAGRSLFAPEGSLAPAEMRRLARNSGTVTAPYVDYASNFEVGQAATCHIWRQRTLHCETFESLIIQIRVLDSFLDKQALVSCESIARRSAASRSKIQRVFSGSQRDLRTGVPHHFVLNKKKRAGSWVSSDSLDLSVLIVNRSNAIDKIISKHKKKEGTCRSHVPERSLREMGTQTELNHPSCGKMTKTKSAASVAKDSFVVESDPVDKRISHCKVQIEKAILQHEMDVQVLMIGSRLEGTLTNYRERLEALRTKNVQLIKDASLILTGLGLPGKNERDIESLMNRAEMRAAANVEKQPVSMSTLRGTSRERLGIESHTGQPSVASVKQLMGSVGQNTTAPALYVPSTNDVTVGTGQARGSAMADVPYRISREMVSVCMVQNSLSSTAPCGRPQPQGALSAVMTGTGDRGIVTPLMASSGLSFDDSLGSGQMQWGTFVSHPRFGSIGVNPSGTLSPQEFASIQQESIRSRGGHDVEAHHRSNADDGKARLWNNLDRDAQGACGTSAFSTMPLRPSSTFPSTATGLMPMTNQPLSAAVPVLAFPPDKPTSPLVTPSHGTGPPRYSAIPQHAQGYYVAGHKRLKHAKDEHYEIMPGTASAVYSRQHPVGDGPLQHSMNGYYSANHPVPGMSDSTTNWQEFSTRTMRDPPLGLQAPTPTITGYSWMDLEPRPIEEMLQRRTD